MTGKPNLYYLRSRPEFASRRATKTIDGAVVTGWFTEDLTLAEIRTLRARERLPRLRGTALDGRFAVLTFDEVLALVAAANARPERHGRRVGVYPETKHPWYFGGLGLALETPLLGALRRHGLDRGDAPVFIQSFEVALRRLATLTRVSLVQLIERAGRPWDLTLRRSARTYADLVQPEGLREVAAYARHRVHKDLVLPHDGAGGLESPTSLVRNAHAAGLLVHVFTLRAEAEFLPAERRRGASPSARGDMAAEATLFLAARVDGYFTDFPAIGVEARKAFLRRR